MVAGGGSNGPCRRALQLCHQMRQRGLQHMCSPTALSQRMQQGYPSGRGVGGPWRPVLTTGQHAGRLLGGSGKAPQDAEFTNSALVLAAIQQDKTRHRSSMRSEVRTPEWICPCARSNRAGQGQYRRCTCSHSNSTEQDSGGLCTCHRCGPQCAHQSGFRPCARSSRAGRTEAGFALVHAEIQQNKTLMDFAPVIGAFRSQHYRIRSAHTRADSATDHGSGAGRGQAGLALVLTAIQQNKALVDFASFIDTIRGAHTRADFPRSSQR